MLIFVVIGAVAVGIALGLLGGGGSILAVPLLVYVAGLGTKEAIATSLLVVGVTSGAALVSHARARRVQWRTGVIFGLAGMAGAYAGGRMAAFIPGPVLLVAFSLMMLATAAAMLRGRKPTTLSAAPAQHRLPVGKIVAEGSVVGLVTGLVGAGGGFLVVPALVLLGGLPMASAVGTSLVVISMKSMAGLAGYLAVVEINWALAAWVGAAAAVGSLGGARLAARVDQDVLRRVFGWFVVVMGVFVLAQQLPGHVNLVALPALALAAAAAGFRRFRTRAAAGTAHSGRRPVGTASGGRAA